MNVTPTREEKLLGRLIVDLREGDFHRAEQAISGYKIDVMNEILTEIRMFSEAAMGARGIDLEQFLQKLEADQKPKTITEARVVDLSIDAVDGDGFQVVS